VSFASKFKTMGLGPQLAFVFYAVVGVVFFVLMPFNDYPPHIGLTGILSLIAAYGLFMKRFWSVWLVAALFFVANAFCLVTLYFTISTNLLASLGLIAYLILSWLFTIYILNSRKKFGA
jgi:hypothetical protein